MSYKHSDEDQELQSGFVTMSNIVRKDVNWLWRGVLARGEVTVLAGDPDVGKSFLTCYMAAIVSSGRLWPDGSECPAGDVLMCVGEDSLSHVVGPRLDDNGANSENVHAIDPSGFLGPATTFIQDSVESGRCRPSLVIVDTVSDFSEFRDGNDAVQVRREMLRWTALARHLECAVAVVCHTAKGNGAVPRKPIDRVMGSRSFVAVPRTAFQVSLDPQSECRRILAPIKSNLTGHKDKVAWAYTIDESGRVQFEATSFVYVPQSPERRTPGPTSVEKEKCKAKIRALFGEADRLLSKDLEQKVVDAGYSESTYRRALKEMKPEFSSKMLGGTWYVLHAPSSRCEQSPACE